MSFVGMTRITDDMLSFWGCLEDILDGRNFWKEENWKKNREKVGAKQGRVSCFGELRERRKKTKKE